MQYGKRKTKSLLDAGSEVCLFPANFAKTVDREPCEQKLTATNGTDIRILCEVTVTAELDGR
jgi:hypothetical protein